MTYGILERKIMGKFACPFYNFGLIFFGDDNDEQEKKQKGNLTSILYI